MLLVQNFNKLITLVTDVSSPMVLALKKCVQRYLFELIERYMNNIEYVLQHYGSLIVFTFINDRDSRIEFVVL